MNKIKRFKAGLSFGIAMTVFHILQDLLTNDNLSTNQIFKFVISAFAGGAIAGVLFGWLIGIFAKSKFVTETTKVALEPNESILFETPANHFKKIEGVGGKLYLTNKRLIFKSHKWNIQNHELSINLSSIKKVDRYKTLGLVNNGLSVTTNEATEKFVVEQADEWMQHLISINGLLQKA